jgi:Tol biopolymer transport system component
VPASSRIGPFEILERLGAGGMGEVFKARDTRLNRFVALKFLPEAADEPARERFQREAQAIAALNHPHICTLYEVGSDNGRPYLVLELLEGETLKARLRRGALDPDQLLDWSVQISDALDAAHRKGVLHRDLKPENIWVAPGGHVKVLDFGLARLEAERPADQATVLTSPGVALGTVPYMSPEQARGGTLDVRSDIFSFGSVFYEMASGRAAFPASNAADSVAAVLNAQPPKLAQVRPELPPMVGQVAERCLEKDPDLRYQSAADLRGELKRLRRESGSGSSASAVSAAAVAAAVQPKFPAWLWPAAALALLAAGAAWFVLRPKTSMPPELQFHQLTFSGNVVDAVISPDGKFLAHVDNGPQGTSLHLLSIVSNSDVQIMPPAADCCQSPSFSPDGGQVYFRDGEKLEAVPVLGGALRTIAAPVCSGAGFSPGGKRIAYVADRGSAQQALFSLVVAQPDGSGARVLHKTVAGDGYLSQCWVSTVGQPTHAPAWSPDGRWIALAEAPVAGAGHVQLVNASTGEVRNLGPPIASFTAADLSWLPNGSGVVFSASIPATANSQIWEVSYPAGRLMRLTDDLQGYAEASLSSTGQLAMIHTAKESSLWVQARPGGAFRQLPGGGTDQDGAAGVTWTPSGGLASLRNLGGNYQLWAADADGSHQRLLAQLPPGSAYDLTAAPNGQFVFGVIQSGSIWRINADGSDLTELVNPQGGAQAYSPSVALGGREVVYLYVTAGGNQSLYGVPLAGGPPLQLWSGAVLAGILPASPDGSRVFLLTRVGGVARPVIVRVDGGQPQVTPLVAPPNAGGPANWTADGKAVTFVVRHGTVANLWALPVAGGKPYPLTHFTDGLTFTSYAFAPDGRLALARFTPNQDVVLATGLSRGR